MADAYGTLLRSALLPLWDRVQGDDKRLFTREFASMLDWPEQRIAELQWRKLGQLLRHAYDTTPFYRERLDAAGAAPDAVRSLEDFRRIPPLTKAELRSRGGALLSTRFTENDYFRTATGGSTDSPIPLVLDQRCAAMRRAWTEVLRRWCGWRPGDRVALLWGAPQDFPKHPSWKSRARRRWLERSLILPASRLDDAVFSSHVARLAAFRPRVIQAYPSALDLLARFVLERGVTKVRPRAVLSTAEPLYAHQRRAFEKAFGAEVFSFYGSREAGWMGAECTAHEGLHINSFSLLVEVVHEGRPAPAGRVGKVLITDLDNFAMPFVRYEIGDSAISLAAPCSCGCRLPRIELSAGRETDVFVLPDGTLVPGVTFCGRIVHDPEALAQLQFVQEALDRMTVRVVRGHAYTDASIDQLRRSIDNYFRGAIKVEFEFVPDIPQDPSGKTRFCISRVASRYL